MKEVLIEEITPLVTSQSFENGRIEVVFTCPVSGKNVEAGASANPSRSMGAEVKKSVTRNAVLSMARSAGSLFGRKSNMLSRTISDVSHTAARRASDRQRYGRKEKEEALVRAFQSVINQFQWDEQNSRWIHASAADE